MTAYWDRVFEPAIRLAEEGLTVSPRLNGRLGEETALQQDPRAKVYFYQEDGSPKPVGFLLKSPDFAKTLGVLAERGADAFYNGPIAEDIVATVKVTRPTPATSPLHLRGYAVAERSPVCGKYRVYAICGMGPPSSGSVAVLQILSVLEARDMSRAAPGPEAVHWFAEAGRLAFADRALYLGDPGFVNVPVQGLTDPGYLKSRAALVSPDKSMGRAQPGDPPFQKSQRSPPWTASKTARVTLRSSTARQCGRHDDDDRGRLRRAAHDQERFPPQQTSSPTSTSRRSTTEDGRGGNSATVR